MASDLSFKIIAEASEANAELDKFGAKVETVGAAKAEPEVGLKTVEFDAKAAGAEAKVKALGETRAIPKLDLDTSKADKAAEGFGGSFHLLAAGVVAAMPIVGAAIETGIGLGFIGAAALAEKNNAQVKASFAMLGHDVVAEMKTASDQLVPQLAASGHALDAEMRSLGPSIKTAMSSAGPEIVALTDGVNRMATNIMPGFVASMQSGLPVMQGFGNVMGQTGQAFGQSLESMSGHSAAYGRDLTSLGSIFSSFVALTTGVSNAMAQSWAASANTTDAALESTARAVTGLATGAMPVLGAAVSVASGALKTITTTLGPMTPLIGAGVAAWGAYTLATKLGSAAATGVVSAFNSGASAASGLSSKVLEMTGNSDKSAGSLNLVAKGQKTAAVETAAATLETARKAAAEKAAALASLESAAASGKTAVSEVELSAARRLSTAAAETEVGALKGLAAAEAATEVAMGPLGIALAVATVGIGMLGSASDKAAHSGADMKTTADSLKSAFESSNGVVNSATTSALHASDGYKAVVASTDKLGISQGTVTTAVVQGDAALNALRAQLQNTVTMHTAYAEVTTHASKAQSEMGRGATELKPTIDAQGQAAQQALADLNGLSDSYKKAQSDARLLAQANTELANAFVSGADGQAVAGQASAALGLSVHQLDGIMRNLGATGQVASQDFAGYTKAIMGAQEATAAAAGAISDHFKSVDQAREQAATSATGAEHSYEASIRSVADAQHAEEAASRAVIDAHHSEEAAVRSVADAQHSYEAAKRATVDAINNVGNAEHSVQAAQRSVTDAVLGVTNAEHGYRQALEGEKVAQDTLSKARRQAAEDLKTLHLQLADQETSEADAKMRLFDVENASRAYGVTAANAHQIASQKVTLVNELQVKIALDLLKAQNAVNDSMNSGANLRTKAAEADKAGVDGALSVEQAKKSLDAAQQQVVTSSQGLVKAHQAVADAEYNLGNANTALVKAHQAVSDAQYNEQKSAQAVTDAGYALQKAQQGVTDAGYNQMRAHQAVRDAQFAETQQAEALRVANRNLAQAVADTSRTFDLNTDAGRKNYDLQKTLSDAIDKEFGPTAEGYQRKVDAVAAAFHMGTDEAQAFLKKQGEIPRDFRYNVTAVAGVDSTSWDEMLRGYGHQARYYGGSGYAEGGPIEGWSPHPKADNLTIRATAGEFMQPVDTVQHYGVGFMEALRAKKIPRGGDGASLPGFASGGLIGAVNAGALLSQGGAAFQSDVNAAELMGFKHLPGLPAYVPPSSMSGGQIAYNGPGGVTQWAPQILQALSMLGQSPDWLGTVERRMNQESGGNPTIVNTWDSNWLAGTPSVGLMQVIGPTFASNAGPFAGTGPYEYGVSVDPLANTFAGLNYALHRYGSLSALNRPGGYDSGGWLKPGGGGMNMLSQPEAVLTPEESAAYKAHAKALASGRGQQPVTVNVYASPGMSAEQVAAEVGRQVTFAMRG